MEYKKRNGFFVFCFSFIPGAVEMYMGFMKNGVSLMATFMVFCVGLMLDFSLLSGLAAGLAVVTWFYAFFHAWNMYRLSGNILMGMEDRYIWTEFGLPKEFEIKEEKVRRVFAIAFILVGASALWDNILESLRDIIVNYVSADIWRAFSEILYNVPQIVISVAFIYVGIRLIKGKKKELGISDVSGENN